MSTAGFWQSINRNIVECKDFNQGRVESAFLY